jgi:hypothetical protein
VPPKSNAFQELVTVLTQILGRDVTTAPAMLPDRAVPGALREVDICVEGKVAGHTVLLGIECRAWARPQTVEWVEAMFGKHSHLPTSKALVLVSSSGFTRNALKLAEFLGIKAVTPGEVTPGFVGEIVNNLDSVWAKRFDFTPDKMTIVFDPPIEYSDGEVADRVEAFPALHIHRTDSTVLCTAEDLLQHRMQNINLNQPSFRDATGEETRFTLVDENPEADGEPVCLHGGDGEEGVRPRRITRIEIAGALAAQVMEMPLEHGQYEDVPYSTGTVELGDRTFHWVVTEGDEGVQLGARVLPVSGSPTEGQFIEGRRPQPLDPNPGRT